jgi:hypothetical protein
VVAAPLAVSASDTLPQLPAEQETLQITPALESLSTVAVTCVLAPATRVEDADVTDTLNGGLSPLPPHAARPIDSPSARHAIPKVEN